MNLPLSHCCERERQWISPYWCLNVNSRRLTIVTPTIHLYAPVTFDSVS